MDIIIWLSTIVPHNPPQTNGLQKFFPAKTSQAEKQGIAPTPCQGLQPLSIDFHNWWFNVVDNFSLPVPYNSVVRGIPLSTTRGRVKNGRQVSNWTDITILPQQNRTVGSLIDRSGDRYEDKLWLPASHLSRVSVT